MKKGLNFLLEKIKKDKLLIILMLLTYIVLVYCSFNTFLGNDDLPYSFFKRLDIRVTNLYQIIYDNLRYYISWTGRFLIHCIVQFLLMFGKNLWSILNPLIIVSQLLIGTKIVLMEIQRKENKIPFLIFLILITLFLSMTRYKELIYWVAGSVNYLFPNLLILIFSYLYLNYGMQESKKIKIVNYILCFLIANLHENSFVFIFVFMISHLIINYANVNLKKDIVFFIPIIIGGAILLLAPGNFIRNSYNTSFYSMSLVNRLMITIPYVSKSVFNLHFLIPFLYFASIVLRCIKRKKYIISMLLLVTASLSYVYANGWLYFLLALLLLICEIIYWLTKNDKFVHLILGFYAISFSMVLTPLYNSGRPDLLLWIWLSILFAINLMNLIRGKLIIYILSLIIFIIYAYYLYREIDVYYNIGKGWNIQLNEIEKTSKNQSEVLYLKKIDDKYVNWHVDVNVVDENFWTYKFFVNYYNLNDNVKIIYVD